VEYLAQWWWVGVALVIFLAGGLLLTHTPLKVTTMTPNKRYTTQHS
jgi:hypothetical protein